MSNQSFKSLYRFGGTVFFVAVFLLSTIFGIVFKACGSNNVVNVNLPEERGKDTIYVQVPPKYIQPIDTVKIKEIVKPRPINKPDTTNK